MIEPPNPQKYVLDIEKWKQHVPQYEYNKNKCMQYLKKQIAFILPNDFNQRVQKFRQFLVQNHQIQQQYLDVLLYYIQGKQDTNIINLASQIQKVLGMKVSFWQSKILQYATNQKYGQNFYMWEVKKQFTKHLHIEHQFLSNLLNFRKISKEYIDSLVKLINLINKAQKRDDINKIDLQFEKTFKAQTKYQAFLETIKIDFDLPDDDDNQASNVSRRARQNAQKTLFNVIKPHKKFDNPKGMLPLQNFFLPACQKKLSRPSTKIKQKLKGEELQLFEEVIKTIKDNSANITDLRNLFKQQWQQKKKDVQKKDPFYSSIFDSMYYFSYVHYPISLQSQKDINFLKPFHKKAEINYQIDSQEQFNQLIGQDLNDDDQQQQEDDIISHPSFIENSDQQSVNGQGSDVKVKKSYTQPCLKKWQYNHKQHDDSSNQNRVIGFQMFYLTETIMINDQVPIDNSYSQEQEDQFLKTNQEVREIINNRSKKDILKKLDQYNQKVKTEQRKRSISRTKMSQFLKKNCKIIKSGHKKIYQIVDDENGQVSLVSRNTNQQSTSNEDSKKNQKSNDQGTQKDKIAKQAISVSSNTDNSQQETGDINDTLYSPKENTKKSRKSSKNSKKSKDNKSKDKKNEIQNKTKQNRRSKNNKKQSPNDDKLNKTNLSQQVSSNRRVTRSVSRAFNQNGKNSI